MLKMRLYALMCGLLVSCHIQGMFKQLTKPFFVHYGNLGRAFSVVSSEEIARAKKRIKEIQMQHRAEHFVYHLTCAGIRLDNHTLYNALTENYENKNKKLKEEFDRELAKLEACGENK